MKKLLITLVSIGLLGVTSAALAAVTCKSYNFYYESVGTPKFSKFYVKSYAQQFSPFSLGKYSASSKLINVSKMGLNGFSVQGWGVGTKSNTIIMQGLYNGLGALVVAKTGNPPAQLTITQYATVVCKIAIP